MIAHLLSLTAFTSGLLALVLALRFSSEGRGRLSPKARATVAVAALTTLAWFTLLRGRIGPVDPETTPL